MSAQSPERRSQIARLGAHVMHARYDSRETSAPGRAVANEKLNEQLIREYELDLAVLGEEEFARRLAHARSAHFSELSLKRVPKRSAKRR